VSPWIHFQPTVIQLPCDIISALQMLEMTIIAKGLAQHKEGPLPLILCIVFILAQVTQTKRMNTHNEHANNPLSLQGITRRLNIGPLRSQKKEGQQQPNNTTFFIHLSQKSPIMSFKNENKRHSMNYTASAPVSSIISRTTSYGSSHPVLTPETIKLEVQLQRLIQE
jgi:hypothetical protein